jgi:hypothetical protein
MKKEAGPLKSPSLEPDKILGRMTSKGFLPSSLHGLLGCLLPTAALAQTFEIESALKLWDDLPAQNQSLSPPVLSCPDPGPHFLKSAAPNSTPPEVETFFLSSQENEAGCTPVAIAVNHSGEVRIVRFPPSATIRVENIRETKSKGHDQDQAWNI